MWRALLIVAASAVVVGPAHAGPTGEPEPELRALLAKNINAADSFEHRFDAEVWLVDMSGRLSPYMKDEGRRLELLRLVPSEARRAKLAPAPVQSVDGVELGRATGRG